MAEISVLRHLDDVRSKIARICEQYHRDPSGVQLMAVSKAKPVSMIEAAIAAGQRDFGENYLQEALEKISAVSTPGVQWHYIGAIQSNKTRAIAENFHWVHTVSSLRVARRLDEQRPVASPDLKVMVQVNISGEESKAGVDCADAFDLIGGMLEFRRLEIRGLMAIPAASLPFSGQRESFRRLRELKDEIGHRYGSRLPAFVDLSMGMSGDMEAAIAEGATWLRIGTAIFGARD